MKFIRQITNKERQQFNAKRALKARYSLESGIIVQAPITESAPFNPVDGRLETKQQQDVETLPARSCGGSIPAPHDAQDAITSTGRDPLGTA